MHGFVSDTELEAVKALFNEKEKELAMAVARVDQLTRQLKDLKSGVGKGLLGTKQANAAIELEKLRRELLVSCVVIFVSTTLFMVGVKV